MVFDTGNGNQAYGYWIRTNSLNGYIYASFVGGEHPTAWVAGIWVSTDNGQTWNLFQTFPIHNAYYGSNAASNFYQGTMYFDLELDSGWQNGIKLYPTYNQANNPIVFAFPQVSLSMIEWAFLGLGTIAVLAAVAVTIVKFSRVQRMKSQHLIP